MEAEEICGAKKEKRHMIICGRDFTRKSLYRSKYSLLFAYDPRTLRLHEDQDANAWQGKVEECQRTGFAFSLKIGGKQCGM